MASSESTMTFTLVGKDKLSKPFSTAGKSADKLGMSFGRVSNKGVSIGATFAKVGGGVGLAAAGIIAAVPKVIGYASSLQLMQNKSQQVFGSELGRVQKWAQANAFAMGLTTRQAVGLAAGFSDLLKPMGFTSKQAADMSTRVVGLSGALAEWSGGTKSASEVSDILSAAMLGERDALQGLGISISQAQVDAQVLANKKKGLKFATLEQAQAQATMDLILAKSTDAQAAFAKGSGTMARRVSESKARLKEVGETLLVTATPALQSLVEVVQKKVVPQLVRFGEWLAGPGKFVIASSFLSYAESATGFGLMFLKVLRFSLKAALDFTGSLLTAMTRAFGWVPELGPKLKSAQSSFESFRTGVDKSLDNAIDKVSDWNSAARRMQTEVKLKGDIENLKRKLADAKTALADPNLTKERKAQINADIKKLQAAIVAAQAKVNSLQGKNVTVTLNAIVSKQFAGLLSGRLDYFGRAIGGASAGGMGRVLAPGTYRRGVPFNGYPGHTGQDLPAKIGTPVFAPFAGVLSNTDLGNRSYGRFVSIQSGQWRFIGAHLSRFARSPGAVARGSLIGFTGSTGNSTGPHLHAELRRNGHPVNPRGILPYRDGGWLMPGMAAYNETSRPEAVFNLEQLRDLSGPKRLHPDDLAALMAAVTRVDVSVDEGTLRGLIKVEAGKLDDRQAQRFATGRR